MPAQVLCPGGGNRNSGAAFRCRLAGDENDGRYAMIGSIGGSPKNPSWVYNLRANPKVAVQDGNKVFELTAREVHGAEREEWWQRGIEAYPHYIELQSLTTRKIPVFVLE